MEVYFHSLSEIFQNGADFLGSKPDIIQMYINL